YNSAVPMAMAALVGKPIIVPPAPGLMGAFGVALEIKKRIKTGLMEERDFDLNLLANREVTYGKTFICKGGTEKCDRKCKIAMIEIEGKRYPFGGACNRYDNLRKSIRYDVEKLDMVRLRQHLIFEKYGAKPDKKSKKTIRGRIGINRSFMVNTYYPLYSTFFTELEFEPVIPDLSSQEGIDRKNAAFCYPAEQAHGFFYSLLQLTPPPEFIFLPHFKAVPTSNGHSHSQVCPFVQGETFYLQTTCKEKIDQIKEKGTKMLTPLLDLTKGMAGAEKPLIESAIQMGATRKEAIRAFRKALKQQADCMTEMKEIGKEFLKKLETTPDKHAVVIFARPYNGFVEETNMGIPHKFASRGFPVIPFDFLAFENEKAKRHMYWGMGQSILKAARFVKKHPQLFGTYITNFSCGPDSFMLGYFRNLMGRKPSLTLELDSHTADAGLETRIEAFLDIVSSYRQLMAEKIISPKARSFVPARTVLEKGILKVITTSGEILPMTDPRVTLLFPSMGEIATQAIAAIFRAAGFNAKASPPPDEALLKLGRANTSCKECLPLILTTGTLLNYIHNEKQDNEVLAYFMPTASGPCRFGQYHIFMEDLVKRLEIPNVALFALTAENSYAGLGNNFNKTAWWAVVISDVMEDIRSMLLANAADSNRAMGLFKKEWRLILSRLEKGDYPLLEKQLIRSAEILGRIPLKRSPEEVPVILLTGEIFVRRESLSRRYLTEHLAKRGFAVICSPISEWIVYTDYLMDKGLTDCTLSMMEKLGFMIKKKFMGRYEKRLKSILSGSGLVHAEPLDIKSIIDNAKAYISPNLSCETVLTVGSALTEAASTTCGVIAIGPFGCMPNRLAEAILNETMNSREKLATDPKNKQLQVTLKDIDDLPFLTIETDGSPFPQVINAQLDTFCLRAERLHKSMLTAAKEGKNPCPT
ncbi:MAG: activase, partial [Deltaproteobacteria bacterium]|nr:activase [Deltaproteobacteria bacterium]